MNFKMWVKSKFVLWQPRYNNLLTKKRVRKFTFLKHSFFENILLPSISINFFQTTSSNYIVGGNFVCSNSSILLEDLTRWMSGFEIFLIDHYAGDIGNKNIAVTY